VEAVFLEKVGGTLRGRSQREDVVVFRPEGRHPAAPPQLVVRFEFGAGMQQFFHLALIRKLDVGDEFQAKRKGLFGAPLKYGAPVGHGRPVVEHLPYVLGRCRNENLGEDRVRGVNPQRIRYRYVLGAFCWHARYRNAHVGFRAYSP